jgi:hypothetical protein
MKKIFTLFAAALVGLSASAYYFETPCPSKLELTPLEESQPADAVFLELGLVYNNSPYLNGYNVEFGIVDANGADANATWKRAQGANWCAVKDYSRYILEMINLDGATIDDFTDADLNDMIGDMFDNKANNKTDGKLHQNVMVVIHILSTNECRVFPQHAGKTGKLKIDLSALPDGEYRVIAEATPETASMSYLTPNPEVPGSEGEEHGSWCVDEDIICNLTKAGDVVTGINTILESVKAVTNVTYYNLQGVESATPFDGVNIVVRTYEDGSKDAIKILK